MIHELITLARPLMVFDCETTSSNPDTARICQLGFQRFTAAGPDKRWSSLIDPGIPIPPETTAVHGISDDMIRACWKCHEPAEHENHQTGAHAFVKVPTFPQLGPMLAEGFSGCDFAGKNVRFDLRTLQNEMNRYRIVWGYESACILDADRLEQLGVPRTLADLYRKYTGEELKDAHDALADVDGTVTVILGQLRAFPQLPRDLRALHDLSWPGWIDVDGKFKFENGQPVINFGKHKGTPMRRVEPGYYRWMLGGEFSANTKRVAENALRGVFPQPSLIQATEDE